MILFVYHLQYRIHFEDTLQSRPLACVVPDRSVVLVLHITDTAGDTALGTHPVPFGIQNYLFDPVLNTLLVPRNTAKANHVNT
mmetsp:Transcript_30304/g.62444  ORF Transcript_30304/g.62444 Transcript_30304/m.62444 type:complete len:83 (-) Transcript_30304:204-452(-)